MASIILTLAFVGLILYRIYKYMFTKPHNFPPGPPRLPWLGSYPFMLLLNYRHMHKSIDWLCKYYKTDVLGMYAASFPTVVANTAATVKECLNNIDLDGKPQLLLASLRDPEFTIRGIFFTEGKTWHEQRRYILRNMRDFGFGRRFDELELEINDEIAHFVNVLKNGPVYDHEKKYMQNGKVFCPNAFAGVFGNLFLKVLINERLPREKQRFLFEASEQAYVFMRKGDDWGRMFSYLEWIAKVFPNTSEFDVLRKSTQNMYASVKEFVDDQYKTFDPNHERHFLDIYFKEMNNAKSKEDSTFCYNQLVSICVDLFIPSLNATSVTIQFLLQRFHFQPEILHKCQSEIDRVVGQGRLPTLNDRINLPYTEATLREVMRHETLVPSGLPHTALRDTKFMGYDIPKGSIVFSSLSACNEDPTIWNKPKEFNPERFLDKNGQFSVKLDQSLPFGAGKRLCAGETFARNVIFLAATALIQNFNFKLPENERMPDVSETHTGILRVPPPFWLRFESR